MSGDNAQKVIVLAFDIERSGGRAQDETFAIGASVVGENGMEMGSLCLKGYFPGYTKFEKRTWDEFWSKNKEILETLKADNSLFQDGTGALAIPEEDIASTPEGLKHQCWHGRAIEAFHEFRKKWELKAKAMGWKLETVSDNKVYDGGFINDLYAKYMVGDGSKVMPLPYSASDEPPAYKKFRETHSEQRGLLFAIDPTYKGSLSKRVEELYDCTAIHDVHPHDHNPAHDAYSIAREAVILNGIRDRRISLRSIQAVSIFCDVNVDFAQWVNKVVYDVCPEEMSDNKMSGAAVRSSVKRSLEKFVSFGVGHGYPTKKMRTEENNNDDEDQVESAKSYQEYARENLYVEERPEHNLMPYRPEADKDGILALDNVCNSGNCGEDPTWLCVPCKARVCEAHKQEHEESKL